MISELHLELTELYEAGIDLIGTGAASSATHERGLELAATCIRNHPGDYLRFVEAWFSTKHLE